MKIAANWDRAIMILNILIIGLCLSKTTTHLIISHNETNVSGCNLIVWINLVKEFVKSWSIRLKYDQLRLGIILIEVQRFAFFWFCSSFTAFSSLWSLLWMALFVYRISRYNILIHSPSSKWKPLLSSFPWQLRLRPSHLLPPTLALRLRSKKARPILKPWLVNLTLL